MRSPLFSLIIGLVITLSCSAPAAQEVAETNNANDYATGFTISDEAITIHQPYPGAENPQVFALEDTPQRIIVTGTTHLPYLEMLDVGDRLVGFPGLQYIYSPYFRARADSGFIVDLGPDNGLNLELVFSLQPDLVIAFDMGSESTYLDKLEQAGIPLLYNSDFLEPSLLGRAEWIKVFGAIFNKRREADAIFTEIADSYHNLASLVKKVENRPEVFSGILYGDAWFLPGGNNGSAQLFEDAGADYLWSTSEESGWLELSFESVYEKAYQADYWVGIGTLESSASLGSLDNRYTKFDAFKSGDLYNYCKRIGPEGGYDYFESGYARPDLVLKDLIAIFHPQLLPDHEFVYFERLK